MPDAKVIGSRQLYIDPRPLNREMHASWGLMRSVAPYAFASATHLAPITVGELSEVSAHYPIVFMGDGCVPSAVLGLKAHVNAFVDRDGAWRAGVYVPAYFRLYPFAIASADAGDGVLCVDAGCDRLRVDAPDLPFFKQGQATEIIEHAITLGREMQADETRTQARVAGLKELDLFAPVTLRFPNIELQGAPLAFEFVGLDHSRVNSLNKDAKAEIVEADLMSLIVAWQFSQRHWQTIARMSGGMHGLAP